MEKLQQLGASWSMISRSYRDHFVPRFKPWVVDAMNALIKQNPNTGLVFVPGCGTGQRLAF